MGFGKAKYDVEEKGLDPKVAHKEVAQDGRLTPCQPSETSVEVLEAARSTRVTSGVEKAVEDLKVQNVPVVGLDSNDEVVSEKTTNLDEVDEDSVGETQQKLYEEHAKQDVPEVKTEDSDILAPAPQPTPESKEDQVVKPTSTTKKPTAKKSSSAKKKTTK